MKEIWKPIAGYEGLYEVSNLGRVRSLDRYIKTIGGVPSYFKKGVVLKQQISSAGYMYVTLKDNQVQRHTDIHRLVAIAFVPNPNNYPVVNHKDENKTNNHFNNLEWCDYVYNACYGLNTRKKAVNQYTMDGVLICSFDSVNDAARSTGLFAQTIGQVCKGKCSHTGGYIWKYAN